MIRRDNAYWQRLRKDRRSNAAALLAVLAGLAGTLALISVMVAGTQHQSRANPLYWLLLVPIAWWSSGLTAFEPRAIRLWKPALAVASCASMVALLIAVRTTDDWTAQAIACGVTLAATTASLLVYRSSLVQREGPAR